jgi:hypothetical protein
MTTLFFKLTRRESQIGFQHESRRPPPKRKTEIKMQTGQESEVRKEHGKKLSRSFRNIEAEKESRLLDDSHSDQGRIR